MEAVMQFAYGYGGAASPLAQKHLTASPYRYLCLSLPLLHPFSSLSRRLGPARLRLDHAEVAMAWIQSRAAQLSQQWTQGTATLPSCIVVAANSCKFYVTGWIFFTLSYFHIDNTYARIQGSQNTAKYQLIKEIRKKLRTSFGHVLHLWCKFLHFRSLKF